MKSFGIYISKHLVSFIAFILLLLFVNAMIYGVAFHRVMTPEYQGASPRAMVQMAANAATPHGLSGQAVQKLRGQNIWAMYLDPGGRCFWSLDLPKEVPQSYTIQDVALFSKGYIADYPVFVWGTDDGLLVLGYPKSTYTKFTSNYYSIQALQRLPLLIAGMLGLDLLCLFLAYCFSKRRILRSTGPIVAAVETLADGKPVSLHIGGELSGIACSINQASRILSRQNEARANWISGISHDIRTPLSVIMGYAGRIAQNEAAGASIREQAEIVRRQSVKLRALVQDLNLVSQLEYEMQPLDLHPVRLPKLLRSYAAELLNSGISDAYRVDIEIAPDAETAVLACDARLVSRAVGNLVQNSIQHNPAGCEIRLSLERAGGCLALSVADDGVGLSAEKLQELQQKPHYLNSTDERLDLRHGLGLLLVRQIVAAHRGAMQIESAPGKGCKTTLLFPGGDLS